MKKVVILVDSENNKYTANPATEILERYSIDTHLEVISPHKQPARLREIVKGSEADAFICIAGLSAALPGIVASITPKPVIGVPVDQKLMGIDSLLSMTQMPDGFPVATVGVDNAKNAAYLALRILAIRYPEILSRSQDSNSYSEPEHSEPTVSEYKSAEPETSPPVAMPDFMTSATPDEPVTFEESKPEEPVQKKKPRARGDWWM